MNAVSGANGTNVSSNSTSETLANLSQAHAALDGSFESLSGGTALSVGRAFSGTQPGFTAPSNAAVAQYGATVQSGLETVAPYLKGAGYLLGAVSIGDAYQSGGSIAAAYATADVAIETSLSSTLAGAGAAILYDQLGGSRAYISTARQSMALSFCSGISGL